MQKLTYLLLAFAIVALGLSGVEAQTITIPANLSLIVQPDAQVLMTAIQADTATNPMSILTSADTVEISLIFLSPDTTGVDSVIATIGTTLGGSDVLQHTFVFDQTPAGNLSWLRTGTSIKLGAGHHAYSTPLFGTIQLKSSLGAISTILQCDTQ